MKYCLACEEELEGRVDKKYCSEYCKSAYHYERNKQKEKTLFRKIDDQLKLNRKILRKYNTAGKATVRKAVLHNKGFNPKYFTHGWRAKNGNLWLFCYEYGFMKRVENEKEKYVLVTWQPYMED
ncbi:hypothetical protein E1176_09440 [Fulvivirga sp. RKSG066]|uniref:hypothetical protein n=1 Tax=Fulvivirga aurantia TaxID=2529383 RepID=UPI0012BD089C|nr:hypothetical protein [Fulvivirga aurantia]MTI21242.1 hypothetical protein [Fulvivirga aurantia]